MGQKVNPIGFRLAVNKSWSSKWYATPKDFPLMLKEDLEVRNFNFIFFINYKYN